MNKKSKIIFSIFFTLLYALISLFWFFYIRPRYPFYQEHTSVQIIVLIVSYLLVIIIAVINRLRVFLVRKFALLSRISLNSFILFMICLLLSLPLLLYFIYSSQPEDNILPSTLKFNIIELSGVLGGLVLTAAAIPSRRNKLKSELIASSRYLLLATILFVFSTILAYNAFIPVNNLSLYNNISRWGCVLFFYAASSCFFMGIFKLIYTLFRFDHLT